MSATVIAFNILEWALAALLALVVSLIAIKRFKMRPIWAFFIGAAIFACLTIPIPTHAVRVDMPAPH
jgi:uncharacterized membrane protein YjjB (DUF3815 family)